MFGTRVRRKGDIQVCSEARRHDQQSAVAFGTRLACLPPASRPHRSVRAMRIALASCENPGMDPYILDLAKVRDFSGMLLDEQRCLRVVPARILEGTTPQERLLFGVRHGVYSFPTVDLCSFLRSHIRGRRAIEIGSGHGALARALAIPATDGAAGARAVTHDAEACTRLVLMRPRDGAIDLTQVTDG